ncbi:MAG: lysophospholipid acyltransferase family protein, partial [Alphaproteobacteria bacterium]
MNVLRAGTILSLFMLMTITLIPLQAIFVVTRLPLRKHFPNWYHKQVCRLLGIRVHVSGSLPANGPVLLASNHISWLDIPVLSSVTPLSFVAKREVSTWPFINVLAWLQRTIFVDRKRRTSVGKTANKILQRLDAKERVVLFAEGTSSDGNQVLDFKSSLFAAVEPNGDNHDGYSLQTIAIAYTHVHGLPMNRQQRPAIAWYGDMDMLGHAWGVLKGGPLDVHVRLGEPVYLKEVGNR